MTTAVAKYNDPAENAVFELGGVRFDAGGHTLLDGIDLTLDTGRVYGLIGHNGSGKRSSAPTCWNESMVSRWA